MLRSMYAGISGLQANQTKLDVVGNNIANVGTTGFKSQSVNFQDTFSQNVAGAVGASRNFGGTNGKQVGLGAQIGTIATNVTQGNFQTTSRNLDCYISGSEYFMVGKGETMFSPSEAITVKTETHDIKSNPKQMDISYTRDGSFTLDNEGNLLTSDGYRVLGYAMTSGYTAVSGSSAGIVVTANASTSAVISLQGASGINVASAIASGLIGSNASAAVTTAENSQGLFVRFVDADSTTLKADFNHLRTLKIPDVVYKPVTTTDSAGATTIKTVASKITKFNIEKDGLIKGTLSDGSVTVLGQIATASFKNPAGLSKVGGNLLAESSNSGTANIRLGTDNDTADKSGFLKNFDNSGGFGSIQAGGLEMSNVDLSQQFTDMIIASRAFQANGKIITTGDEILQDLVGLKR